MKMRKFWALLLAVALLCSLSLPAYAAGSETAAAAEAAQSALAGQEASQPAAGGSFEPTALLDDYTLVNYQNFPDGSFRQFVRDNYAQKAILDVLGLAYYLTTEKLASITAMDCSGLGIANFKGLEYFTSLTSFDGSGNNLTSPIDVTAIPVLYNAVYLGERTEANGKVTFSDGAGWLCVPADASLTGFHNVRFNLNGGTGNFPTQTVADGECAVWADDVEEPKLDGYVFEDWYLGDEPFDWDAPVTSDITLTAKWLKIIKVDLDYNGGNVNGHTSDSFDFIEGMTLEGQLPTPKYDVHCFDGWLLNGNPYDLSTELSEDIELTASWIGVYTLHFDRSNPHDGGGVAIDDVVVPEDGSVAASFHYEPFGLGSVLLQNDGDWQFLGWDTDPNAALDAVKYPRYQNGAAKAVKGPFSVDMSGDVTLYSVFGQGGTITVMKNDGTDAVASGVVAQSGVYSYLLISDGKLKRTGYELLGLSKDPNATEPDEGLAKAGYVYYYAVEDTTLYAVWKAKTYTLSFDLNGGQGAVPDSVSYTLENKPEVVLPGPDGFTWEHRVFLGWSAVQNSTVDYGKKPSGTLYQASETLPASFFTDSNKTLYIVWQYEPIAVSLDMNGFTGFAAAKNYPTYYNYGASGTATSGAPKGWPTTPTSSPSAKSFPEGFTGQAEGDTANYFSGWMDKADGSFHPTRNITTANNGTARLANDRDTELLAVWRYSFVSYLDADGEVSQIDATVVDMNNYVYTWNTLTVAQGEEKLGYSFKGWATEKNGTVVFQPGDPLVTFSDLTLWPVYLSDYYVENPVLGTAPAAPDVAVQAGKTLFCGYYYDEEYTQPVMAGDDVTGAYAKFVDAKVLKVGIQFRDPSKSGVANTIDMRLITSVPDAAAFSQVGFLVERLNPDGSFKNVVSNQAFSNEVYSYVTGNDADGTVRVDPSAFCEDSAKVAAQSLWKMPVAFLTANNGDGTLFRVTAYLIFSDGTQSNGTPVTFYARYVGGKPAAVSYSAS